MTQRQRFFIWIPDHRTRPGKMVLTMFISGPDVRQTTALGKPSLGHGAFFGCTNVVNKNSLINVVGDIRPEQIATLGERFNLEPLKQAGRAIGKS